jgi:tripartite-type tricarboxylate transporter receptor subunit TctC
MAMPQRFGLCSLIILRGSTVSEKGRMTMISRRHALGLLASSVAAKPVFAQARYPDRPIRLIVPFGPGGLADVTARVVGEKVGQLLGQQVVIVNQPGAGGVSAARAALGSPADGYTLMLFTNGTAISVPLVKELGYDPLTQFTPVSSLGFFDFLLLTSAEQTYKSLADLLAAARAKPGAINIGTINVGSSQNRRIVQDHGGPRSHHRALPHDAGRHDRSSAQGRGHRHRWLCRGQIAFAGR